MPKTVLLIGILMLLSCNIDLGPRDPEPNKQHIPATLFQLRSVSSTTIHLSWKNAVLTAHGGIINYSVSPLHNFIDRRTSATSFSLLAKIDGDSSSYVDSGLDSSSTYFYQIRSVFLDSGYAQSSPVQIRFTPSFPFLRSIKLGNVYPGIIADISLDGKFIAATYNDAVIHLLDAETGNLLRNLGSSSYMISSVLFSPSGKYVSAITGYYDSTSRSGKQEIMVFLVPSGGIVNHFRRQELVSSAAVHVNDSLMISSGSKPSIVSWRIPQASINGADSSTTAHGGQVVISPKGDHIAMCNLSDNFLRIGRTNDGTIIRNLAGHTGWPRRATFSRDGSFIVSGSSYREFISWRVDDGQLLHKFEGSRDDELTALTLSSDDIGLISGYRSGRIRIWDIRTGSQQTTLAGHSDAVIGLTVTHDGKTLFSSGIDKINVWSLTPLNVWNIAEE